MLPAPGRPAAAGPGTPPLGIAIDSFVTTTVFAHLSPSRCWFGDAHTEIAPTRYGKTYGNASTSRATFRTMAAGQSSLVPSWLTTRMPVANLPIVAPANPSRSTK